MLGTRWIADRLPTERFPTYTRANAGEVMSDPFSPLGWSFVWERGIVPGCRDGFVEMGVVDTDEYDPVQPESFGLFGSYLYNNLGAARLFGVRSGAGWQAMDLAYFDDPSAVPPYEPQDWHESPRHTEALGKKMAWIMTTDGLPEIDRQKIDAKAARDSRPDLSTQTPVQLVARALTFQRHLQLMFKWHVISSLGGSVGPGTLTALLAEIDPSALTKLLAGLGDVDSAQIAVSTWKLGRIVRSSASLTAMFESGVDDGLLDRVRTSSASGDADAKRLLAGIDTFMYENGSRGPNEWDIYSASFETRPTLLLSAIDRLRTADDSADPALGEARVAADRERLTKELEARFADDEATLGTFRAALRSASIFMVGRERNKTAEIRIIGEIRACFEELGRRMAAEGHLDDPRHVYMLLDGELDAFLADPASLRATLVQRAAEHAELFHLEPPYVVDKVVPPLTEWKPRGGSSATTASVGDVLKGVAGAPGTATGTAKVLLSLEDPTELEPGDILVAPNTDPAWTPLFLAASAVVVNVGSIGTHAVIVSRELGIPCVPAVADATVRIPTGAVVTVDGAAGTVTIVSLPG